MEIQDKVIDQLEEVRESGEANMMNQSAVQWEAKKRDLHALVLFCEDAGAGEYMSALDEMGERA